MKSRTTIEVTTGTIVRGLLLILGILFLYAVQDIILIIFVAIIIASAVEPLVKWFHRYRIPRVLGVLIIYLTGIVAFIAIFYLLLPPLFGDLGGFFERLPALLETAISEFRDRLSFLPLDQVLEQVRNATSNADSYFKGGVSGVFSATSTVFSGVVAFILVIVISFYLAVQEDGIANVLRIITPRESEEYILSLWARSQRKIGRWLQGQMLLGLIIGVIVFISLTILQVHYAFILAILSAIFEIIPYFGPIMAAIPAIAVAAIQEPLLGLLVAGIFVLVQQIENHLIYPLVVRKTVGVPPLLAIIALLIGGKLAGIMGVIVAVPSAVVLVEFLNDIAAHKKTFL